MAEDSGRSLTDPHLISSDFTHSPPDSDDSILEAGARPKKFAQKSKKPVKDFGKLTKDSGVRKELIKRPEDTEFDDAVFIDFNSGVGQRNDKSSTFILGSDHSKRPRLPADSDTPAISSLGAEASGTLVLSSVRRESGVKESGSSRPILISNSNEDEVHVSIIDLALDPQFEKLLASDPQISSDFSLGEVEDVSKARPIVSKHHERVHIPESQLDSSKSHKPSRSESSEDISNGYEQARIEAMVNLRIERARAHSKDTAFDHRLILRPRYVNLFSKGLPHDEAGFVDPTEMEKLLRALHNHDLTQLGEVRLGGTLKLLDPSAAWSNDLFGACNNSYRFSQVPELCDSIMAAEMAELYCMSLARDIPFSKYSTDHTIEDCSSYLNALRHYPQVAGPVSSYNIFRGPTPADLQGPYISQFLYRNTKIGGFPQIQKYATDLEGSDFMKTWETAVSVQNGVVTEGPASIRSTPRYLITGRDLASYVHSDEPYLTWQNACSLLFTLGVPLNPTLAASSTSSSNYHINLGRPDIQALLGMAGRSAQLAAWYQKWHALFLRPEAFGLEVERVYRNSMNPDHISGELLRNPIIERIRSQNGNALLPQAYPEGAPLHPSTPAAHGAVAGACATILKFFFDARHEIEIYAPNADGTELIATGQVTTVGDEINKLASNMVIGRCWAGIHYNMDAIRGLKLGQKVAISCLQDLIYRYPQKLSVSLTKFNGKVITISN
jgi:membrane-associated phospholipid phosphatase